MFGRRFGKMLKTAILAGLLCFQSVPMSEGMLNVCGEKVESVLGKAGDAIGNAFVLHAEAAENTGTSIAEYSGLRVPPIRDRIPANRAMIPLCFQ